MWRGSISSRWVFALAVALCAESVHACRASERATDSTGSGAVPPGGHQGEVCGPGVAGCPCAGDGAAAACGTEVGRHGDYVTCAMGRSACAAGTWGTCISATLVTKSIAAATLGSGGLRALSTTVPCQDPCDPNTCTLTWSGAGDVDAATVVSGGDGAVTIAPSRDAGACQGLDCQVARDCPAGSPTTITGFARDPAGTNPLYGAFVYVPADPSGRLPAFTQGASCDACAATTAIDAMAVAQTGPDGSFVLTNVPSTDLAPGNPVPLVVQIGKWRREVLLPSVPKCRSTAVDPDDARLPRSRTDGFGSRADIPKLAIATGAGDPFECLLLKIGIDPSEFQVPGSGAGRIDYYVANGVDLPARGGTSSTPVAPDLSALVGSVGTLMNYDAVFLPCEGFENDVHDSYADQVSAYANGGGRLFTSHYGYTWLSTPGPRAVANAINPATGNANPFFGVASWALDGRPSAPSVTAGVDTTLAGGRPFADGRALTSWLKTVAPSTTTGQVPIDVASSDVASVGAASTRWVHNLAASGQPYLFSFDTPVGPPADGGAGACGRVVYSDFHASNTARVDPGAEGACNTDADCGFTATCRQGAVGTCSPARCTSNSDCARGYTCAGVATGQCVNRSCRTDGECASVACQNGKCLCTRGSECLSGICDNGACMPSSDPCGGDEQCGLAEECVGGTSGGCVKSCTADGDCGAGELCVSGQCQGCRDGSFCPSGRCNGAVASTCSASAASFPLACRQGPLSPQEDVLEFMLFDLIACIPQADGPPTVARPVRRYDPATFSEDFASSCPQGTRVVWRELDWQASIPTSASIAFSAQTVEPSIDGGSPDYSAAQVVPLATATSSTPRPGVDAVLIDTATTGAFNAAMPAVMSRKDLRLTVTLYPTLDGFAAPTLIDWQVKADCLPAE